MHSKPVCQYDVLRDCAILKNELTFRNLYELICAHGDNEAAVWLDGDIQKSLSYNQLKSQCDRCAAAFSKEFGTTGRVCVSMDAGKEWFPVFWGLIRSGHDVLAVDPSFPDDKVKYLMDQCGCRMIVSSRPRTLGPEYPCILSSNIVKAPAVDDYKPVWGHDIALCTSGTTAESKIFVYEEETICQLALFSEKVYNENHRLIDNEAFRTLAFLPFHHVLGFAGIFIWSHFLGYTVIYLKDRAPQTIQKTAKLCHVSQIVTVPLLANSISRNLSAEVDSMNFLIRGAFKAMVNISLSIQFIAPRFGLAFASSVFKGIQRRILGTDIRSIVLGGSHTDPRTLRLLNGIGYYSICGFGMTETAINSFETSYRLVNRLSGSVGAPLTGTEYRIKGGGNVGELQIRGKGIHDGRFVNGEFLPADVDKDGWFSTGDVMRIIKDAGLYFIEGRIKEVIINESGENVYPDELEDLFSGLPFVQQFSVLGLPKKGSPKYEDIAFVASVGECIADKDALNDIASALYQVNSKLPVYKKLNKVYITNSKLPSTNTMKIRRNELRKSIINGTISVKELDIVHVEDKSSANSDTVCDRQEGDEIRESIRAIYAEVLNRTPDQVPDDAHFINELGGDSLQVMAITSKVEDEFGIFIPSEAYSRVATVREADKYVHELLFGTVTGAGKLTEHTAISDFEETKEFQEFKLRMESLKGEENNPYFVCHDSPLLDTSVIGGKPVIDFGSYNYVGMSGRREVSDAAIAAINKYGTSASGSRLLAGEKPVHGELERAIAEWKNAESALVCVGGHSTNVTVVGNFCGKNDLILYDALAHNSIEQGCKLSDAMAKSFPHNDIAALEKILKAQRKYFEKVLIIIEGVYSMDGDIADIPAFVEIKKKYGCFLMVDEAHSSCVLGETGGGVDEYFHLAQDDIDIKFGTLSKGLGTCGGYIAGRRSLVEYLRYNLPGFVFSVGISPALAAGSLEAIRLLRNEPSIMKRLHDNIACFAEEAEKRNLNICLGGKSAILPVLVGKDEDAFAMSTEMLKRGVSVPPAVYPAVPKNKARLRFDVISEHKPEQIIYALDTLLAVAKDLGIELPGRES